MPSKKGYNQIDFGGTLELEMWRNEHPGRETNVSQARGAGCPAIGCFNPQEPAAPHQ
jgi:hypothetical protein